MPAPVIGVSGYRAMSVPVFRFLLSSVLTFGWSVKFRTKKGPSLRICREGPDLLPGQRARPPSPGDGIVCLELAIVVQAGAIAVQLVECRLDQITTQYQVLFIVD